MIRDVKTRNLKGRAEENHRSQTAQGVEGHSQIRSTEGHDNTQWAIFLALKNFITKNKREKALYISQGYNEKEKPYIVHDFATIRSSSICLISSVAAINFSDFFS